MYRSARGGSGCSLGGGRILIALILVGIALFTYFGQRVYNPVTDETQHISITPQQEVALGLQAAPEMEQEFGGQSQDAQGQALVDQVCANLVKSSSANQTDYPFACHLLADQQTINAFALPGGQVFVTEALFKHLETEGQLAGVLGHEIGHVVARHGAEHIAKQQLTEGLDRCGRGGVL